MTKNKLIFILLSVFLASCSKDKIFEKHHSFDNNTWAKTEVVTFETNIEDIDSEYDILIAVRHMSGYPFANVVVGFTIETPVGEKRMMQHNLIIRNTDGSFKGNGLGDIWDIEVPVYKKLILKNSGLHKFSIENKMHLVEMPGIMSVGLVIRKSEEVKV